MLSRLAHGFAGPFQGLFGMLMRGPNASLGLLQALRPAFFHQLLQTGLVGLHPFGHMFPHGRIHL